jgi:hypothetical protein
MAVKFEEEQDVPKQYGDEREESGESVNYSFRERLDALIPNVQAVNGKLYEGEWVVVKPDEDYGRLVGQVTGIIKPGADEHDADGEPDEVRVNVSFINCGYAEKDEAVILDGLRKMRPELNLTILEDFALDNIVMNPENLINLTRGIERTDEQSDQFAELHEEARDFLRRYFDDMENELMARIEKSYADYKEKSLNDLKNIDKSELVAKASRIHACSDAWSYMTAYHDYSYNEVQFYSQFENPLEIVADAWHERQIDVSDVEFTMDDIFERRERMLQIYPLIKYTKTAAGVTEEPADTHNPPEKADKQPKQTAPKKKKSITAQIHEAGAEAKAHNAQRAQNPKNQRKRKSKKEELS